MQTARQMILSNLLIAEPCPADWSRMSGDEKRRFCGQCQLHVYNLSAMTDKEAAELLTGAEGERLCVKFYRRYDGTVMTSNCPLGVKLLTGAKHSYDLAKEVTVLVVTLMMTLFVGKITLECAGRCLQTGISQAFSEIVRQQNMGNRVIN